MPGETGGFILIDRITNATIAAGVMRAGRLASHDIPWQVMDVTQSSCSGLKGHPPAILWFTGISGAGKSTIAIWWRKSPCSRASNIPVGRRQPPAWPEPQSWVSDADRVENVRRVAEVSEADDGRGANCPGGPHIAVSYRATSSARKVPGTDFIEVFVDTLLAVAEARDLMTLREGATTPSANSLESPVPTKRQSARTSEKTTADASAKICDRILRIPPSDNPRMKGGKIPNEGVGAGIGWLSVEWSNRSYARNLFMRSRLKRFLSERSNGQTTAS